jgi:hypothetical protein
MASDSIELLSRIAPISDEAAAGVFGELGRERLLAAILRQAPARQRRLRRPLVLAVAVLVVAAATGAGWAALSPGPARETTAIDCVIDGRVGTVIDATTGDPAADCAAIWPAPVPKLQAYDDGIGGVAVIPASAKAPAGWTPIESQDVVLVMLQENLDDKINGLDSACFGSSQATTFAQQQLDLLGFVGWTTTVRSGGGSCYRGFADPQAKTVTLMAMGDPTGVANWPPQELADSLRPLTQQCLSLSAMQNDVVERATALGMSPSEENYRNYRLTAVPDDTLSCATVTESVAGTTAVVVRGPA